MSLRKSTLQTFLVTVLASASVCQQSPKPAAASGPTKAADSLCSAGGILCVAKSLEHSLISSPLQIAVQVSSSEDIQVDWEVDDAAGQALVSGSSYDYVDPPFTTTSSSKTLHIKQYLLKPSKSAVGMLVLTPSRFDVSSGKTDLPKLEIPIRLNIATTKLTILLPADPDKYQAEVASSVEGDFSARFEPKTPLVPQSVIVMKVARGDLMGTTAEAVLQAMPGQATWHVTNVRMDGGVAHIKLDAGGWAGVTYYSRAICFLIDKSLLRFRGVAQVIFD